MTYSIVESPKRQANLNKSNLYGLMGSAISCVILFLFMWLYAMPFSKIIDTPEVQQEGLMISFGYDEQGGGQGDTPAGEPESYAPVAKETASAVKENVTKTVKTSSENYVTQNDNSEFIAQKK